MKYLILGMSMQALISSMLDIIGLIDVSRGQQTLAGILFLITYLIIGIYKND